MYLCPRTIGIIKIWGLFLICQHPLRIFEIWILDVGILCRQEQRGSRMLGFTVQWSCLDLWYLNAFWSRQDLGFCLFLFLDFGSNARPLHPNPSTIYPIESFYLYLFDNLLPWVPGLVYFIFPKSWRIYLFWGVCMSKTPGIIKNTTVPGPQSFMSCLPVFLW